MLHEDEFIECFSKAAMTLHDIDNKSLVSFYKFKCKRTDSGLVSLEDLFSFLNITDRLMRAKNILQGHFQPLPK